MPWVLAGISSHSGGGTKASMLYDGFAHWSLLTAKRLRNRAQGCRASRLPWEMELLKPFQPHRGCDQALGDATLSGLKNPTNLTQGSRAARQPGALLRNRFAVRNPGLFSAESS